MRSAHFNFITLGTTILTALFALSRPVQAQGLGACGDIHVEAEAQCEVIAPGIECEAECTPISVEAACAAQLHASCDGQCSAEARVDCGVSCQAGCMGSCEVDPGQFSCSGECRASCGADCSGMCSASGNRAECEGSCRATCDANCDVSCDVVPPMASCEGKCEASCDGKCEAEAEIDCQIDCQASGYAECKVEVQGGCEAACETQDGALFCDSQYVDYGDNLSQCVAALEAAININVMGYADGSSSCEGNTCEAEGKAGVSCSATPGQRSTSGWSALAVLGGIVLGLRRRVTRKK